MSLLISKETGKNALDFYIAAECGIMSERGEANIAIISRDKGFQAVIDFLCSVNGMSNVQIVRAENIEIALTMINAPEDSERRKTVQQRMLKLDLAVECAKIYERSQLKGKIKEVLKGTEYEYMENEIINFIQSGNQMGKKELYTGSLHSFGRKNGTGIYNLIKNNVTG